MNNFGVLNQREKPGKVRAKPAPAINSLQRRAGQVSTGIRPETHLQNGRSLQRTCSCGRHTISGGVCSSCRQEVSPVNSGSAQNSLSQGTPTGTTMNVSRFSANFSQIPVHGSDRSASYLQREVDPVYGSIMRKGIRGQSCDSMPFGDSEEEDQSSIMAKAENESVQRKSGGPASPMLNISRALNQRDTFIQAYKLKGFPPAKEALMHAAIPKAKSIAGSCKGISWWGRRHIPRALERLRYDYKPNLGLCGWTFPGSWYMEVGKSAFNKSSCCDLESTLAHEASHTQLYTEGRARKMECKCFNCC